MVSGLFFVVVDVVTLTLPKTKQKPVSLKVRSLEWASALLSRASQVAIALKTHANAGGVTRFRVSWVGMIP